MMIENPAFNYDKFGQQYSKFRESEPRIATYVNEALASARTVLNVGAGAGSYEPTNQYVIAVEPSSVMRSQRLAAGRMPAVNASADSLPFDDDSFDAAIAVLTVHHWPDIARGIREMRRVAKHDVIVMTFDPDVLQEFWIAEYFPEVIAIERARYPKIEFITEILGGSVRVIKIPVPYDCVDGFQEAFYGRPEAFLSSGVRSAQSAWGFLPKGYEEQIVKRLADQLKSGEWDRKHRHFRSEPFFSGALRLVISHSSAL